MIKPGVLLMTYRTMTDIAVHQLESTLVSFNFTVKNHGKKLICDEKETALANMCFFPILR